MSKHINLILRALFVLFALWQILLVVPFPLSAQSPVRWSVVRRVPGYVNDASPPLLVADQNRTVHALGSQMTGGELAIFYNQWTATGGWTRPIDVLLSPIAKQANIIGAFLDSKGMMHVAFFGGNNQGGSIFYSRVPALSANHAPSWTAPKIVDVHGAEPASGVLLGDKENNLFLVYSGNGEGNGLYAVQSTDGGETWSEPATIFVASNTAPVIFAIQGTLDSKGRVHVVWTVDNVAGNGEAVYYARLEADHQRWSRPAALQTLKAGDYEADWGSIVAYNNELFVIYNYGQPPHRWMRRSTDGGRTWTDPAPVFPSLKGENGHSAFLVDSSNVLHVIFANRTLDDQTHGVWHSEWMTDQWSEPEAIISGLRTADFAPVEPKAVLVQGNEILVTWRQDPGQAGNGIWYSNATLDAPEAPRVPLPTVQAALTATPTDSPTLPSPTGTPALQVLPLPQGGGTPPAVAPNPALPLILGTIPVVLLILGTILVKQLGIRR